MAPNGWWCWGWGLPMHSTSMGCAAPPPGPPRPPAVTPAAWGCSSAGMAWNPPPPPVRRLKLRAWPSTPTSASARQRNHCVSQGSDLDPKLIHLIYRPDGEVKRRLALVGKGLTFDSGGYNLKVGAAQIDMMKFDMGGSAAVLGAMRAIAER